MMFMGDLPGGAVEQDRKLAKQIARSRALVREALGRLTRDERLWRDKRMLTVDVVPANDAKEILATRRVLKREVARSRVSAPGSFA